MAPRGYARYVPTRQQKPTECLFDNTPIFMKICIRREIIEWQVQFA
ncbi:hypothetical protein M2368_003521 [Arthrobacter sp. JUb119]|nr:hypothetical protein [Arthrobacter sp. JUb119]TDU22579.1 hypothetical protein EDF61_109109 [Arthrobacter sp. JUb115]